MLGGATARAGGGVENLTSDSVAPVPDIVAVIPATMFEAPNRMKQPTITVEPCL